MAKFLIAVLALAAAATAEPLVYGASYYGLPYGYPGLSGALVAAPSAFAPAAYTAPLQQAPVAPVPASLPQIPFYSSQYAYSSAAQVQELPYPSPSVIVNPAYGLPVAAYGTVPYGYAALADYIYKR